MLGIAPCFYTDRPASSFGGMLSAVLDTAAVGIRRLLCGSSFPQLHSTHEAAFDQAASIVQDAAPYFLLGASATEDTAHDVQIPLVTGELDIRSFSRLCR
jgi:hypothetical protein